LNFFKKVILSICQKIVLEKENKKNEYLNFTRKFDFAPPNGFFRGMFEWYIFSLMSYLGLFLLFVDKVPTVAVGSKILFEEI